MALGAEAAQKRKRQIKAPWRQRLVDFFEFKANLISAARSGGGEGEEKGRNKKQSPDDPRDAHVY